MATDTVEILNRRNAEVAKIRSFADLTEEAKQRRIAEVNERAQAEYEAAVEANERAVQERLQKAEKAVFATSYPFSATDAEKAQIRAARRAAYESVHFAVAPAYDSGKLEFAREELERLLTRAERTGDPELADAVYHVATERGERSVADAYLSSRPTEKKRWEEYAAARMEADAAAGIEGLLERALTDQAFRQA